MRVCACLRTRERAGAGICVRKDGCTREEAVQRGEDARPSAPGEGKVSAQCYPSHGIRATLSESRYPSDIIRVTGSEQHYPSHGIRVTVSEECHGIRATLSESRCPSHVVASAEALQPMLHCIISIFLSLYYYNMVYYYMRNVKRAGHKPRATPAAAAAASPRRRAPAARRRGGTRPTAPGEGKVSILSKSWRPSDIIRVTVSDRHCPSYGIRVTLSESRYPRSHPSDIIRVTVSEPHRRVRRSAAADAQPTGGRRALPQHRCGRRRAAPAPSPAALAEQRHGPQQRRSGSGEDAQGKDLARPHPPLYYHIFLSL